MTRPTLALRRAILLGLGLGLASAGCSKDDEPDSDDTSSDADTDSVTQNLDAVPDGAYPECGPDDTGGFVGPCCVDVHCIDADTDGTCRPSDAVTAEELTGLSLGTGNCQCTPVEGPYAPRAEDSGDCCYLVGIQGCSGRPVVVQGRPVRARARWGRPWAKA